MTVKAWPDSSNSGQNHEPGGRETVSSSLFEQVRAVALDDPSRPAVSDRTTTLSYGELASRAETLGRRLVSHGAGPGDRVGVMVERGVDLVVALFGVSAAGAAYVPLDPGYPKDRLRAIAEDADLALVVTDSSAGEFSVPVRHVPPRAAAAPGHAEIVLPTPSPQDPAYVIYTSGSTGRPKGVIVTNANVAALFDALDETFGTPRDDTFLAVTSVSFDIAVMELFWPLTRGGTSVVSPDRMVDRLDPHGEGSLRDLMRRFRPTLFQATPSLLSAVASYEETLRSLRGLRVLSVGGEVFPVGLARRLVSALPGVRVCNMYGPTEATVWCAVHEVTAEEARGSAIPIGTALGHARLRVVDDQGVEVVPGEVGELWVGGSCVTAGYLRMPDRTEERFVDEAGKPSRRWYRTGDRVRSRWDGALEFVGRFDRQIKISGVRIELDEIEAVLSTSPDVRAAAVVAHRGTDGSPELVAYVQPVLAARNHTASGTESDLSAHWGRVWDAAYTQEPNAEFVGWRSSYTGDPIPVAEMRAWLYDTVRRIESTRPRRVLDVGVGAGTILRSLAPRTEHYVGIDMAPAAIRAAARQLDDGWDHVSLRVADADSLSEMRAGEFDTVVLNSIVQYFPGLSYLHRVLTEAARITGGEGAVFIGDVRDPALLEALHATAVLHHAAADTPADELAALVSQRVKTDRELCVPGEFFAAFAAGAGMDIVPELKRGTARNELTSFRYDVTLLGAARAAELDAFAARGEAASWERVGGLAGLKELLEGPGSEAVTVTGIPNARLTLPLALCGLLADAGPGDTASDVKCRLASHDSADTPDIESVAELGDRAGRPVRLVPHMHGARCYDAWFGERR
ncbi:amino acid adenylation domain-containing protein [Streptomyces sp. SLBN-31]|uniref:amino acid adenylation domain-containing protein n=1 Tax=Streptomyces sp. SLBN-31 TaxID=2768444 RepID=UPI001152DCCC|nr:amino acid adenylation domain-containing protein [Streptomyces sp. SLBN-31]